MTRPIAIGAGCCPGLKIHVLFTTTRMSSYSMHGFLEITRSQLTRDFANSMYHRLIWFTGFLNAR